MLRRPTRSTHIPYMTLFPIWLGTSTPTSMTMEDWLCSSMFLDLSSVNIFSSFSPTFLGLVLRWQDWEIYFEGLRVKPHSAENFGDKVKLCRCFQQTCNSSRKSRRFKGQQRRNLTRSPKLAITFSACFKISRGEKTIFSPKILITRTFFLTVGQNNFGNKITVFLLDGPWHVCTSNCSNPGINI